MHKVIRINLFIMYGCFGLILSILISPLVFDNQKMIPLKSKEVTFRPENNMHYEIIPLDINKYPEIYTRDIDIYKIPALPYFLIFIEILLITGIILNERTVRKIKQTPTEY